MSPYLIALAALFFVVLFSQFGHRLPARRGLIWWLVAAFLFVSAVNPYLWRPLVSFLGIEVISNFVLSVMMMFLFFQMVEQQAENLRFSRQITELTSSAAAREFPPLPGVQSLVVLPCRNEVEALPAVLGRLQTLSAAHPGLEYCVVNDGSLDGTLGVLQRLAPARFVTHPSNVGVSGGLLTGFKVAQQLGALYVVQCDADGQHPVEQIARLVQEAQARNADLLIGSRLLPGAEGGARPESLRRTGAMVIRAVLRLYGRSAAVSDPTSGFRVYSQRAITVLRGNLPDEYPEPESIALCALVGLSIQETATPMEPRRTGTSSLVGLAGPRYVAKVCTALIGLRLRSLFRPRS